MACLCVLLPAWQPTSQLPALIAHLEQRGFEQILVVDDGSAQASEEIFTAIAKAPRVQLLRHAVNCGKGRALKTGFRYLLNTHPHIAGVITADADGQHTPEDVERVARALLANPGRPILGSRGFEQKVPLRSRIGNSLTRKIFASLTGVRLADTQTGLRGLPVTLLPALLALKGERYEYEMTVLAHLCRTGPRPLEVPVATVYLEGNGGSHFHPVWDSLRVYSALLRWARPR